MCASAEPEVSLDDVLGRVGAFGRYQLNALCMLAFVYATNSIYNVNYVFAVEDVRYRCRTPESEDTNATTSDACAEYTATGAVCSSSHYDIIYDVPDSFMAEFELGCQEWKAALVGTAHCFGSMVGLLFQGQISDNFGRKWAAVVAGSAGALLGVAKSYSGSYWLYVALESLEAAVGDALSPIFMLSIEIVPKSNSILYQMILLNCYTAGLILMPLIAATFTYWRHFLRVIYAPTLLILAYVFCLDESIRWLFSKGRRHEGVRLIKKAAKMNGVQLDAALLDRLQYIEVDVEPSDHKEDGKLLLKTFNSKIMMQRFLVCSVWWFTITLINYGMMISSVLIAGDKYVNFALLMLMDVPANVLYWFVLVRHDRKRTLLISFLIGGLFCVLQPFVPEEYAWVALVLFMSFELLATFSYNIVYMYTSELFPTYTRNSMHALCSSVGRLGSLLAPQIPLLVSYWSGMATVIFGVTSLLSGLLVLLMPETAGTRLPDTVAEAESIGNKRHTRSQPKLL